jgi:hypothetical protein
MVDVRRAIEYLTEDEQGPKKLLIGAVLTTIPLANVVAFGYEVEVTRRVARGEPRPLPEWNDLGGLFVTGAWLSLARLIYYLPVMVVLFGVWAASFVFVFQIGQSSSQTMPDIGPVVVLATVCIAGLVMVYSLLISILFPAVQAEYARRGTLAACFDLAAIFRFIRRDPGQYFLALLAELALSLVLVAIVFVVVMVLAFIPCVGSIAAALAGGLMAFVLLMFNAHLVGQLMRADASLVIAKER